MLTATAAPVRTRALAWDDVPAAIQGRLTSAAVDAQTFPGFLQDHDRQTRARVREGNLDALVYYALQSTAFTRAAPIEPALSARAFVESLDPDRRGKFLAGDDSVTGPVPSGAQARLTAVAAAVRTPRPGSRLAYFRDTLDAETPAGSERGAFLRLEYVRAMRFLYEKEFVAQRTGGSDAVAALYRQRGLSTDTAVEAGYLVHLGLATLQALEPARRIHRVLIIGPGLDLAPRTGLIEAGAPESYQPYAVVDSLVSLGLARLDDLVVVGADVNARVVDQLNAAHQRDVVLTLVTGVGEDTLVSLDDGYRQYFSGIGRSIGALLAPPKLPARYDGHLRKALRVRSEVSGVLSGVRCDVATQRIEGAAFDLVIATNILPYLDDTLLALALGNIAAMLGPGGVLLHNESRPLLAAVTGEIDLPLLHARTGAIAAVRGAAPLADAVWIHEKGRRAAR